MTQRPMYGPAPLLNTPPRFSRDLRAAYLPKWVAKYCGTSIEMLDRHYRRWMGNDQRPALTARVRLMPGTTQPANLLQPVAARDTP